MLVSNASPIINRTKIYNVAFAWALIIYLYSTGPFALFDLLGIRRPLQIVLGLFLISSGAGYAYDGIFNGKKNGQIALLAFLGFLFIFKERPYLQSLDFFSACYFIWVVKSMPPAILREFLNGIVNFTVALSAGGILLFVVVAAFPAAADYTNWPENLYLSTKFSLTNPLMLLGGVTNESFEFLGLLPVPRIKSFLYEPSLITLYFMVPAALSLQIKRSKKSFFAIALFCMLSLSGTFYVFLASVFTIIALVRYFRSAIRWSPLVVWLLFAVFLRTYVPPLVVSEFHSDEEKILLPVASQIFTEESYRGNRGISATIRLAGASWGLDRALQEPLLGAKDVYSFVFGFYIFVFVNGGLVALVMCTIFATKLFGKISAVVSRATTGTRLEACCVILSALYLQAFIYSDYGFSSAYGMIIVAVVYRVLCDLEVQLNVRNRPSHRPNLRRDNFKVSPYSPPPRRVVFDYGKIARLESA